MISNNTALTRGGGIYNVNSSPALTNVTISHNTSRTAMCRMDNSIGHWMFGQVAYDQLGVIGIVFDQQN
jgi:hypothetical protein